MNEEQHLPEDFSFLDQLPDSYHPVAADLSAAGIGSWKDLERHLVLSLQSRFPSPVHRDDGGGNDLSKTCERPVRRTLHGWLLDFFLEVAGALRFAFGKCPLPDFFDCHNR